MMQALPVHYSDFSHPTDVWLREVDAAVAEQLNFSVLTEHGLTEECALVEEVESTGLSARSEECDTAACHAVVVQSRCDMTILVCRVNMTLPTHASQWKDVVRNSLYRCCSSADVHPPANYRRCVNGDIEACSLSVWLGMCVQGSVCYYWQCQHDGYHSERGEGRVETAVAGLSNVYVGADVSNPEAVAAARVASLLITEHCHQRPDFGARRVALQ
eukprot:3295837-Amphidinium_carterae.1